MRATSWNIYKYTQHKFLPPSPSSRGVCSFIFWLCFSPSLRHSTRESITTTATTAIVAVAVVAAAADEGHRLSASWGSSTMSMSMSMFHLPCEVLFCVVYFPHGEVIVLFELVAVLRGGVAASLCLGRGVKIARVVAAGAETVVVAECGVGVRLHLRPSRLRPSRRCAPRIQ